MVLRGTLITEKVAGGKSRRAKGVASTMANGKKAESRSFNFVGGKAFLTTRLGISKAQEQRARDLNYAIEDTGTKLYAYQEFEITGYCRNLEEMRAIFSDEKIFAWAQAQQVLDAHQVNRTEMDKAINLKPSGDCKTLLDTVQMMEGAGLLSAGTFAGLSDAERADKDYLLALLSNR